jgi:levanase/fructan beta-fructosidase
MKRLLLTLTALALAAGGFAQDFPAANRAMLKVKAQKKYLMLPVEDNADGANIQVIGKNSLVKSLNVRLARQKTDYYVPLEINGDLTLDIDFWGENKGIEHYACWKDMPQSDDFNTQNRERFRPEFHHTPVYGWMNDPNGMFYLDCVYHLYYQWNPYGSTWENMTWGHSTSKDLVNWTAEKPVLFPDALGAIFSGSCVVDKNNTAGFGKNAIVAFYTSAGRNQVQSMAYSTDGGYTFTKYDRNPVLIGDCPDFRDPKVFWNSEAGFWNMILAAGQEMRIYSSKNLKDWKFESSFGAGYGAHGGVWECPDLMKIDNKWVLICNINPGGIFGGSATQYFVGDFDGKRFTTNQKATLWLDYGKDHYATVTFFNAPYNRRIALAWMSNWQYANNVPTNQFRSANSVPRDLGVFAVDGNYYCSAKPSPELLKMRGSAIKTPSETCEIVVDIKKDTKITLSNSRNEYVTISYNKTTGVLKFDRTHSGDCTFSPDFAAETSVKVPGGSRQLRIFIDRCSIEVFDSEGKAVMTNLVFPSEYYSKIVATGCKTIIYKLNK